MDIVFLGYVAVNLIDIVHKCPVSAVDILEQQVNSDVTVKVAFEPIDDIPGAKILLDKGFRLDLAAFLGFPRKDKCPRLGRLLIDVKDLNGSLSFQGTLDVSDCF